MDSYEEKYKDKPAAISLICSLGSRKCVEIDFATFLQYVLVMEPRTGHVMMNYLISFVQ